MGSVLGEKDTNSTQEEMLWTYGLANNETGLNVSTWESIPPDPYPILRILVFKLSHYFIPVIIVFGIVGNLFSLVVFLGTYMRRRSVSLYLAALAVSDTTFLVTLTVLWLEYVDITVFHTNGWCQLIIYLTYCSSFLSVWFVVSFTVERYIAVCHPLRRPDMCTVERARHVVLCLTIACLLAYSVSLWTSGIDQVTGVKGDIYYICTPLNKYIYIHTIYTYADTVLTLLVPFLAILVLNIKIAYKIAYFYYRDKQRRTVILTLNQASSFNTSSSSSSSRQTFIALARTGGHDLVNHDPEANVSFTLCSKAQLQVTKMLLMLSSLFLLINAPSYALRLQVVISSFLHKKLSKEDQQFQMLLQQIVQLIYYTNFAMNFFLYSACSSKFRQAFCRFWKQTWRRVTSLCHFLWCCCYDYDGADGGRCCPCGYKQDYDYPAAYLRTRR